MMVYKYLLYCLMAMLFILSSACGSKRSPTGGEQDATKPVVIATSPAEFADLAGKTIEITFSKPMDRNSLANSVYIYPPVMYKKLSLDGTTLRIKLNEALKQDTNYFITLTTRLKDLRGNALGQNQTLVFSSGQLSAAKLSGNINYEYPADQDNPIELNLFSADSLLVMSRQLTGSTYALENLNKQPYLLHSYIDKNLNGRYDLGSEPYFEAKTLGAELSVLDIDLAYVDTSKVRINHLKTVSDKEIQVQFSEPVASFQQISIDNEKPLAIQHNILSDNVLTLLTAAQDSVKYKLKLSGVADRKGNVSEYLELDFTGTRKPDSIAPTVVRSNPRNGASVNSLSPILELQFSEIIPQENLHCKLISGKEEIPLKILSHTGTLHRLQPTQELTNYRSYLLIIDKQTADFSGNHLAQDFALQFLPLKRR